MSSETVESHPQSPMNRALFLLSFVPVILVALTFGSHAFMGLIGSADLKEVVSVLGFGSAITAILVFFTGLHDGAVTVLVLAKDRIFPSLPWWTVFVYAALWPIVPRVLIWMAGQPFEWVEAVIFGSMALAAWAGQVATKRYGLSWS